MDKQACAWIFVTDNDTDSSSFQKAKAESFHASEVDNPFIIYPSIHLCGLILSVMEGVQQWDAGLYRSGLIFTLTPLLIKALQKDVSQKIFSKLNNTRNVQCFRLIYLWKLRQCSGFCSELFVLSEHQLLWQYIQKTLESHEGSFIHVDCITEWRGQEI